MPIPSQLLQAPKGELNENILGSISSMVKPLSGQAKFDEKVCLLLESDASSAIIIPSDRFNAVSTDEAILFLASSFIIIRSITT